MKHTTFTLLFVLIFVGIPNTTLGSHNTSKFNTSSLGKNIVEEVPVPVLFGVELSKLIPDFGDPRGGGTRLHEGQDMRAPKGTPIVSPTKAIVIKLGTGSSAGKFVHTANPGGEEFRYLHLDAINVKVGDKLDIGDLIGTVGDTGNAPDGIYHLHFEIKDNGTPTDPYKRLVKEFTLKQKISFLDDILKEVKNADKYAETLVDNFPDEFSEALNKDYDLPRKIENALEDTGVVSQKELLETLNNLLQKIPVLLKNELSIGDQTKEVALMQLYFIYSSAGSARDQLAKAGATGYYGPITVATISEYQLKEKIAVTGIYDSQTRLHIINNFENDK